MFLGQEGGGDVEPEHSGWLGLPAQHPPLSLGMSSQD